MKCAQFNFKVFISAIFLICNTSELIANEHPDLNALQKIYESTNGVDWLFNFGWEQGSQGSNCEPCDGTWYGITCENNRVVRIDLQDNNLIGNIPNEVGQLTRLRQLILPNNQLTSIPIQIRSMQDLDELFLQNNQISGPIPNTIGDLRKLKRVSLANNQISGTIPSTLGFMTLLEELNLSNNNLTGSIPNELGGLNELLFLSLSNNSLTGNIPNSLSELSKLRFLYCSNNMLEGTIPNGLGQMTLLVDMVFSGNNLSGCFPSNLMTLCELDFISFSENHQLPWSGDFGKYCNGEEQFEAPCDDGDVESIDDIIRADCSCLGCKMPIITCPQVIEIQCKDPDLDSIITTWMSDLIAEDPADPNPIISNNLDIESLKTLACSSTVEVSFVIESICGVSSCISSIAVIDTIPPIVTCPSDITIDVEDEILIESWLETIQVNQNCASYTVINDYNESELFACFISEEDSIVFNIQFSLSDACYSDITCNSQITCIPQCNMTSSGIENIECNNNNTREDGNDDYITFSLNPLGNKLDSFYSVELFSGIATPGIARYGGKTDFLLPIGSAGEGDLEIKIINNSDNSCTLIETIIDPGTCSDLSITNEHANNNISIYPNPAGESILVKGIHEWVLIRIINNNGQIVKEVNSVMTNRINISELESAFYLMELTDSKGKTNIKRFLKAN